MWCRGNKTLRHLDLSCAKLGIDAALSVVQACAVHPALQVLAMVQVDVSSPGDKRRLCEALSAALANNKTLEQVGGTCA